MPEATVIAVGPGAPNKQGEVVPTTVKPGDRVLLPGWGGNSIKVGEEVSGDDLESVGRGLMLITGVLLVQGFGDSCEDTGVIAWRIARELGRDLWRGWELPHSRH